MMNMIKSGGNPQQMVQNMLMSNPQYNQVMELIGLYNGDAKAAFYAEAEKRGVDPNTIINMLK